MSVSQINQINDSLRISNEIKEQFEIKILNIVQTSSFIQNIYNKVNLLGFIASIEDIRSGECGKGISIVAGNKILLKIFPMLLII